MNAVAGECSDDGSAVVSLKISEDLGVVVAQRLRDAAPLSDEGGGWERRAWWFRRVHGYPVTACIKLPRTARSLPAPTVATTTVGGAATAVTLCAETASGRAGAAAAATTVSETAAGLATVGESVERREVVVVIPQRWGGGELGLQ